KFFKGCKSDGRPALDRLKQSLAKKKRSAYYWALKLSADESMSAAARDVAIFSALEEPESGKKTRSVIEHCRVWHVELKKLPEAFLCHFYIIRCLLNPEWAERSLSDSEEEEEVPNASRVYRHHVSDPALELDTFVADKHTASG